MPEHPDPHRTDETILSRIIGRHQTPVWRYLRSLGAAGALAEDLTAETFVVAWQRGLEDRGDAAIATFLRRTAQNLFLKHCRDQGRREELLVEFADRMWLQDCQADDGDALLAALRECTEGLDGRKRAAVHLCYGAHSRRGDRTRVAKSLGMKPDGLKMLLQRLRAKLRQCIETKIGGQR